MALCLSPFFCSFPFRQIYHHLPSGNFMKIHPICRYMILQLWRTFSSKLFPLLAYALIQSLKSADIYQMFRTLVFFQKLGEPLCSSIIHIWHKEKLISGASHLCSSACQFPTHFSGHQGCLYLELSIHASSCPNANRLQIGSLALEPRNMSKPTIQVWCTVFAIDVNPSDYYFPPYKSYAWNEKTQLISNNNELKSSKHHGSVVWYF